MQRTVHVCLCAPAYGYIHSVHLGVFDVVTGSNRQTSTETLTTKIYKMRSKGRNMQLYGKL